MIYQGKIICDNCGADLDYVLVDGYAFGDRMMEGVMFRVRLFEDRWICDGVRDEDKAYMSKFDWKYWKSRCEEYCQANDLAQCPLCGEEEVLVE